ncbi:MAG: ABC transporter ATP-binding protein [Anaerolineales bacterium]|nr:ABC transporter ATP-binding protein [Anaerolineales bacterium]MDW8162917.1 ABC transporter ATP-binding protein [Anaerolineales bacterium]
MIQLEDVGVRYRLPSEKIPTLKEYVIRALRGQIKQQTFWALQNINLEVYPGEVFGIVGPNGAGKSTLLKVVSRVLRPTKGRVRVVGKVAPLLELGAGFDFELTGRENIFLNGAILGFSKREMEKRIDRIVEFAGLGDFIDAPLRTYSSGMVARLGFAVATDERPEILVVDEILSVGDAEFQTRSFERIQSFQAQGTTILLVTHDIARVETMCQRAIFLSHGQIVAAGSAAQVVDRYLGRIRQQEETRLAEAQTAEQPWRWGNRKIEITKVEFLDEHGQPKNIFQTGEYFALRIEYQAHEPIDSPVFGMAIHHNDGTHLTGPNTQFAGLDLGRVEGKGWVLYEVDRLPLLEGLYKVSVAVHNASDSEMYDDHDRQYQVRVIRSENTNERYGYLTLNGRWSLTRCTPIQNYRV